MGIRTKRKEVMAMKRLTILLTAFAFMIGTFSAAPISFAEGADDFINHEHNNEATQIETETEPETGIQEQETYESTATDQETDAYGNTTETEAVPALTKDTSWFDYENPKKSYKITTAAQLVGFASLVNENQVESWKPTRLENFEGVTFILMNDIELTQPWIPIGTGTASSFAGTFDGNGHTISGIKIVSNVGYAGFFGYLKGQVKNLTVEGAIVSGDGNCGGIAGQLESTGKIINCISHIDIKAKDKTGGIVGYNDGGTIEGSVNRGNISGTYKVGGVVGENWAGNITQCGNKGNVKSSQRGVATYGTGGVAGRSVSAESIISESYNTGEITSNTEATGGVVGYTNAYGASITSCYSNGEILIKGNQKEVVPSWAGGIVGIVGSKGIKIQNCYAAKGVTGADIVGGVIGRYINDPNDITESLISKNYYVSNCYDMGIGQSEDNKHTGEAAMSVSSGSLNKMANTLGAAYINDTSGQYGNLGYPVLKWQEPLSEEEKEYLTSISKDIQIKLDKYLIESTSKDGIGSVILSILDPNSFISNAAAQYHKDKIEEE